MKQLRAAFATVLALVALAGVACAPPTPPTPPAPPATTPTTPNTTTTTTPKTTTTVPVFPSLSKVSVTVEDPDARPVRVTLSATASGPVPRAFRFSAHAAGAGVAATTTTPTATLELSDPGTYTFQVDLATGCPGGVFVVPLPATPAKDLCSFYASSLTAAETVTVAAPPPPTPEQIAAREASIASDVLARHNLERARRGLPQLAVEPSLASGARAWAEQLAAGTVEGHDPAGGFAGENIFGWGLDARTGGTGELAEMVGGSGWSAHVSLMVSPLHRENILSHRYSAAGVGVVCDLATGKLFVVVRFHDSGAHAVPARGDNVVHATPSELPGSPATCLAG